MEIIQKIYEKIAEDSDKDISKKEFKELINEKILELGGLCDEKAAAKLVAKDFGIDPEEEMIKIEEIHKKSPDRASFIGKITDIQNVKSFNRDDGSVGRVANIILGDETGEITLVLWDNQADLVKAGELEKGDVFKIKNGNVREGYSGLEVSIGQVSRIKKLDDEDIEFKVKKTKIGDLEEGMKSVNVVGKVLEVSKLRRFEKKDGGEGKVKNVKIGDESGKVNVSLWNNQAEKNINEGDSILVRHGYVKERYGRLELSLGYRGSVEVVDSDISYNSKKTPLSEVEIGKSCDVTGKVTGVGQLRRFERDDGGEGKVGNLFIDDGTDELRVAMWNEKADLVRELDPGDSIVIEDVYVKEGMNDDIELSAGGRSSIKIIEKREEKDEPEEVIECDIGNVEGGTYVKIEGDVVSEGIVDDGTGCIEVPKEELPPLGKRVKISGYAVRGGSAGIKIMDADISEAESPTEKAEDLISELEKM